MERFACESVRVRAAKPEPPLPLAVEEVGVEVVHVREDAEVGAEDDDGRVSPRVAVPGAGLERRRSRVPSAGGDRRARATRGWRLTAISSTYETEPVGEVLDQPDFLNAAVRVRTELEPEELLDLCKAIEVERGRVLGGRRHGPRPLDVDLLLLGDVELETERLTLPHPEVTSRRFVLAAAAGARPGPEPARRHAAAEASRGSGRASASTGSAPWIERPPGQAPAGACSASRSGASQAGGSTGGRLAREVGDRAHGQLARRSGGDRGREDRRASSRGEGWRRSGGRRRWVNRSRARPRRSSRRSA